MRHSSRAVKTVRRGMGAAASGGVSAGAVAAVLKDPITGWLLITAMLSLFAPAVVVLVIVLMGTDAKRSRFERLMSLSGLLLRRDPARYDTLVDLRSRTRTHREVAPGTTADRDGRDQRI